MYANQAFPDKLCTRADRLLAEINADIQEIHRRIQELEMNVTTRPESIYSDQHSGLTLGP